VKKCPFQLAVERNHPRKTETLLCTALLREIPDKRTVYSARWNDRDVVVKLFTGRLSAPRRLRSEWRGLAGLRERGFRAPEPLFHGTTADGARALVMESIGDSTSMRKLFRETDEPSHKFELLASVCHELARYHNRGVLQKDLHLGNFLLQAHDIWAIDAAQIRFRSKSIGRRTSLCQLAQAVSFLPDPCVPSARNLSEAYFRVRGWPLRASDEAWLRKRARRHKSRAIDRMLSKYQRSNSKHRFVAVGSRRGLFDRQFCTDAQAADLVPQLDGLMKAGDILKQGNTCFVSRVRWNDADIVIKRYNHKGLIHSLRHTIKKSRARRGWTSSHRLRLLGIGTPEPLAFLEQYKGPLVWCSYLIHKHVPGRRLSDLAQDHTAGANKHKQHVTQVLDVLEKLGAYRITHGDMKHSNILISHGEPVLTDLDGLTLHRWHRTYAVAHRKDVRRFRNAALAPAPGDRGL
jgi:tRNA A-37 threonylcarbamoyl transferase component Bud32